MAIEVVGGECMAGKVLVNVYSIQVKNDLLSIFVRNAYDVLEVQSEHDLVFKYNLVQDDLVMYIQEFDEKNHDIALAQLRRIDRERIRCVLLIHHYTSKIIDEALALNVRDVIVLPIEKERLEKKILPPVYQVRNNQAMPKEPPLQGVPEESVPEKHVFDEEPLRDEIIRADRGKYPLSLVLVHYSDVDDDCFTLFHDELRRQLRTTDRIVKYDDHRVLLICPFTPKNNLVEVENKVREAFSTVRFKGYTEGNMFLYGVSYPLDGKVTGDLLRKLKDGIHDSKVFSTLNGPLDRLSHRDVRDRLRRNYR